MYEAGRAEQFHEGQTRDLEQKKNALAEEYLIYSPQPRGSYLLQKSRKAFAENLFTKSPRNIKRANTLHDYSPRRKRGLMKLTKVTDNDANSGCPRNFARQSNEFFSSARERRICLAQVVTVSHVSAEKWKRTVRYTYPLLNVSPRAYLPRCITEWQIKCKYREGGIVPRQILRACHKKNRLKYGGIESKARLDIPDSLKVGIERRFCDRVYSESLYLSRLSGVIFNPAVEARCTF